MKSFRLSRIRAFAGVCLALAVAVAHPGLRAQAPQPIPAPAPGALVAIPPADDGAQMLDSLSLSDNPLSTVLDLLERLTGRSVIRPQTLPTPTFTFNSHGPISKRDAVIALESLLTINAIAVAPMGEKFIKVVAVANVRTEAPELVLNSLRDQPPSGKVVSKLFRLEHLDTTAFQNQMTPFLSPGFGAVVPFQNSSTLLVTDTIANLQRLEYVLAEVDKPRDLVTKFRTLKYAQAQTVAEKIKSLIDTTKAAFNRQPGAPGASAAPGAPGAPAVALPAASSADMSSGLGAALLSATTSISFDERTNQVIMVTDSASIPFFENLIDKLDVQADLSTQIAVIQIQHASATDLTSVLSSFVSGTTSAASRSTPGQTTGRNSTQGSRLGSNSSAANSRSTFGNNNPRPAAPAAPASPLGAAGRGNSQFSDSMTITADDRSNSIVASGTLDDLKLLRELIKKIDVVLPQVRIEVLIFEVQLGDGISRGIDGFNLAIKGNQVVGFGTPATTNDANTNGISILNGVVNHLVTGNTFDMNLVVKAVNSKSRVHILSNPTITTTHNKQATINVSTSVPIVTGITSEIVGTGSTPVASSTVNYQDIGLKLDVTPLIGSDGTVQLTIDQVAQDIVRTQSINGNEQPIVSNREATSFVTVQDGTIIVLGGLRKTENQVTQGRFTLLGELPLIGALFGSHKRQKDESELLMFIRPTVLQTLDDSQRDALSMLEHSKIGKEQKAELAPHGAPADAATPAPKPSEPEVVPAK